VTSRSEFQAEIASARFQGTGGVNRTTLRHRDRSSHSESIPLHQPAGRAI
jgi:hypothetical protein